LGFPRKKQKKKKGLGFRTGLGGACRKNFFRGGPARRRKSGKLNPVRRGGNPRKKTNPPGGQERQFPSWGGKASKGLEGGVVGGRGTPNLGAKRGAGRALGGGTGGGGRRSPRGGGTGRTPNGLPRFFFLGRGGMFGAGFRAGAGAKKGAENHRAKTPTLRGLTEGFSPPGKKFRPDFPLCRGRGNRKGGGQGPKGGTGAYPSPRAGPLAWGLGLGENFFVLGRFPLARPQGPLGNHPF